MPLFSQFSSGGNSRGRGFAFGGRPAPPALPALFSFSSFTFLSGDQSYSRVPSTGSSPRNTTDGDYNTGPSKSELLSTYNTSSNPWLNNTSYYDVDSNGFQKFVIPVDGTYQFTVQGARGGSGGNGSSTVQPGGYGRNISGQLALTQGTSIYMLVGKSGEPAAGPDNNCGGGGGGGSFVWLNVNSSLPLFAAGGGGGGSQNSGGLDAPNSTSGGTPTLGGSPEAGGTNGGIPDNLHDANYDSGGGAGWLAGNGEITLGSDATFGYAPRNGGKGGYRSADGSDDHGGHGGFGGGGGGTTSNGNGGGGGGFSGGGTTNSNNGGAGGGSYISTAATNTSTSVSTRTHGSIQITYIG